MADDIIDQDSVVLRAPRLARVLRSVAECDPVTEYGLSSAVREAADALEALARRPGLAVPLEVDLLATSAVTAIERRAGVLSRLGRTMLDIERRARGLQDSAEAHLAAIYDEFKIIEDDSPDYLDLLTAIGAAYVLARRKQLSK